MHTHVNIHALLTYALPNLPNTHTHTHRLVPTVISLLVHVQCEEDLNLAAAELPHQILTQ